MPEDVSCPYCRDDATRFTIRDAGYKLITEPISYESDRVTVRVSYRPWELEFAEHLRLKHRDAWRTMVADLASRHNARTADPLATRAQQRTEAGL